MTARPQSIVVIICLGLLVLALGGCAPTTATVPVVAVPPFNPLAFSGLTATVTQTFAGPPKWGYTVKGGGAPPAGPAVFDTVTIDFDVPCDPPKSGGTPKITPTTGPSQHYVLSYPFIHSIAAITVTCDAFPTGSATFGILDVTGSHVMSRALGATVAGPGPSPP